MSRRHPRRTPTPTPHATRRPTPPRRPTPGPTATPAPTATPTDSVPPGGSSDLIASVSPELLIDCPACINLNWTAPGDDGNSGTVTRYLIRYSTKPITEGNWDSAADARTDHEPSSPGSREAISISGLVKGADYYFAVKASDEAGNLSALSNVVIRTAGMLSPVAPRPLPSVEPVEGLEPVSVRANFSDGVDDRAWSFAGSAGYGETDGVITLTLPLNDQLGYIFWRQPINSRRFNVSFSLVIAGGTGADGLAFGVSYQINVQSPSAAGASLDTGLPRSDVPRLRRIK